MIGRRTLEAATALLTGAFGLAVVVSSLENGIWSSSGVEAGTFPFLTGAIILAGSAGNLLQGMLQPRETLISATDLRRVATLFVPAVLFIAAIPLIGLYAASAAYVLVATAGRISPVRAVALAVVTPVALYLVFQRMFLVSLPQGWLGQLLGF